MKDEPAVAKASLVPPRPNLGPEPLTGPGHDWTWVVVLILAVLLGMIILARFGRGRGSKSRSLKPPETILKPDVAPIVRLAEIARESLVLRLGPAWKARTAEEFAADKTLVETIGAEDAGRLVALLIEADRVKFSANDRLDQGGEVDAFAAWLESFTGGARSTINGR